MVANPLTHYRPDGPSSAADLSARYGAVRALSVRLAEPLTPEDQQVQSMPDASPTKWHLAHVTWFFETFLLKPCRPGYEEFHPAYGRLFNSYYEAVGPRHARPERGLLTRPGIDEILRYRAHVDAAVAGLIADAGPPEPLLPVLETGLHHEQQHQELLLMDIKHALSRNPTSPAYRSAQPAAVPAAAGAGWLPVPGGHRRIGHDGVGFSFDNETPAHDAAVGDFSLASRLVTNGEFLEFVEDGGYREHRHWHADGWATARGEGWSAPLYWRRGDRGEWLEFTLCGLAPLRREAPVCHVSFYEAAAYASWAGARLPTEQEWEAAARHFGTEEPSERDAAGFPGGTLGPSPAAPGAGGGPRQMTGEVWQWTESAYLPYPGFKAPEGAIGEYNGKFMVNQMVLRGSSWATPPGHARITYRNFFYPGQRWAFSGIRLAR